MFSAAVFLLYVLIYVAGGLLSSYPDQARLPLRTGRFRFDAFQDPQ
jgi:hypothetical protein